MSRTGLTRIGTGARCDFIEIVVAGAQPGAGASTVAVALADVLAAKDEDVTLVDLAIEGEIGASEAVEAKADLVMRGWVGGRRGAARIAQPVDCTEPDEPSGIVILDSAGSGCVRDVNVLVCRATVPSIRRSELVLQATNPLAVAVVGATKWPTQVRSSLGPAMRAAERDRGVVFFPHEATLEINGLTAEPLPASTIRAAGRLLQLVEFWESREQRKGKGASA
jgi:hypothetical protein